MPVDHVDATRQAGAYRSLAKRQMARLFTRTDYSVARSGSDAGKDAPWARHSTLGRGGGISRAWQNIVASRQGGLARQPVKDGRASMKAMRITRKWGPPVAAQQTSVV